MRPTIMTHNILCDMTVHFQFTKRYCFVATIQMMLRQWIKREQTNMYLVWRPIHHSLVSIRLFGSWELLNEYSTTLYTRDFFIALCTERFHSHRHIVRNWDGADSLRKGDHFIVTSCRAYFSQPVWHYSKRLVSRFSSIFSYSL